MKLIVKIVGILLFLSFIACSGYSATADDLVLQWLRENYDLDTIAYEIDILSNPLAGTEIIPGTLDCRPLTQSEPIGLFTLLVAYQDNEAKTMKGQVRLRIRKFSDVLVASDQLKRHENPTASKLVTKRMEVTSLRQQPVTSIMQLDGFRMKRNLNKGKILTTRLIEQVPDIEVGREVSILFSSDYCTITAPGKTLENGQIGERVKVKNTASGKIVMARVIDSKSVAVGD